MKDNQSIRGTVHYVLKDEFGNIKDEGLSHNTITNVFDAHVADQLTDVGEGSISYMALGSGTGQGAASTDLANYITDSMHLLSGTSPLQGTGGDDNDAVYSCYWAAGEGTGSVREVGIFRTSGTTRDTLCTYDDTITVNKGASDTLKVDWTITFGAS
jgi:hypothetical protein